MLSIPLCKLLLSFRGVSWSASVRKHVSSFSSFALLALRISPNPLEGWEVWKAGGVPPPSIAPAGSVLLRSALAGRALRRQGASPSGVSLRVPGGARALARRLSAALVLSAGAIIPSLPDGVRCPALVASGIDRPPEAAGLSTSFGYCADTQQSVGAFVGRPIGRPVSPHLSPPGRSPSGVCLPSVLSYGARPRGPR